MDYIGGAGTNFRRGYSEVPSCIPARHVLMSGQAPDVSGMVGFYYRSSHRGGLQRPCPASCAAPGTRRASSASCTCSRSAAAGGSTPWSWPTASAGRTTTTWIGCASGCPTISCQAAHGTGANSWVGRPSHLPEHLSYSAWVVTRALDYLDKRDPSTPFFLNLSFFPPHPPLAPSRDFFERYAALDLPEPVIGDWVEPVPPGASRGLDPVGGQQRLNLDPLTMHYCRAAYYGLINEIDSQLGRLFNAIRGSLLANTFVMFVSDHGEMLGDHHRFAKTEPFEASARIPFMAMAPQPGRSRTNAEFPSGLTCDAPVGLFKHVARRLARRACGYRSYDNGTHWLVSRTHKYIWYSQTGQELLFDDCRSGEEDLEPWPTHDRGAGGAARGNRAKPGAIHARRAAGLARRLARRALLGAVPHDRRSAPREPGVPAVLPADAIPWHLDPDQDGSAANAVSAAPWHRRAPRLRDRRKYIWYSQTGRELAARSVFRSRGRSHVGFRPPRFT